jgi:RimJ/RimL family protein N-acetyltransferase
MGLNKIFLITNEDNIAAQKVYEKCGFVKEGQLRNEYKTSEGIFMDRIYYGLLKSEWNANN